MKIFIIYDPLKFSKSGILADMAEEKFNHEFKFFDDVTMDEVLVEYLLESSEVWAFGECAQTHAYALSLDLARDIWQMG